MVNDCFTYDINLKKKNILKVAHKNDKGWSRFIIDKEEVYAIQALDSSTNKNYKIHLKEVENGLTTLETLANCNTTCANSSLIKFKNNIFVLGVDCKIFDISQNKWLNSKKMNSQDQMPGVALFSNRFIYVFPNKALVEVLDLNDLESGFKTLETTDNGFLKSYYCEAIQIDFQNILAFGGHPESSQSYKFNVEEKTFVKTKTQLPMNTNFYNNSQPLIYQGRVFVIDWKKRVLCFEIKSEEWTVFKEL